MDHEEDDSNNDDNAGKKKRQEDRTTSATATATAKASEGDDPVVRLRLDLLDGIDLYGWTPNPNLSVDDNLMDLTLLVTRSSQLRQGSMACLLVKPGYDDDENANAKPKKQDVRSALVSVATNKSLYRPNDSDVHAEIVAIASAARYGRPTNGTTAFITMPPCKKCLGALISAGITKIVSRYKFNTPDRTDVCQDANITYVDFGKQRSDECEARVRTLIGPTIDTAVIEEKRRIRREKHKKRKLQLQEETEKAAKVDGQDGQEEVGESGPAKAIISEDRER